ncbi:MAG: glutamate--tRNA ligase family protein, partial [Candidatus Aenigmatarchaeota archaeon]
MLKSEKELILKYCLQNAVFYQGRANPGAVLGKVLAERPGLRKKVEEAKKETARTVGEVNKLGLEAQRARLEELAPELLERKEKAQGLPELEGAQMGKVVTRFAPAPTGPLHLPHLLRAAFLSCLYAERYKGRFILRFEDTDPKKVELKFYKWIQEDLERSGIKAQKVVFESEHLDAYYRYGKELLGKGRAYVCTCPAEEFRELKKRKQACPCRGKDSKASLADWKKMLDGRLKEGEAVVRLRTDMAEPNPVLR